MIGFKKKPEDNSGELRMKMEKLFEGWIETEDKPAYSGWPTIINAGNDKLMAVCSGEREQHVCPFGRVCLYTSTDGAKTWSKPQLLSSGPLDDRDAGLVVAADGSILMNYFTSIVFSDIHEENQIPPHWLKIEKSITLDTLFHEHGFWMRRSTDSGKTWSPKYPVPVNNVHGPTLLADGSLLWVGKELAWSHTQSSRMGDRVIAVRSTDNGLTWQIVSTIPEVSGQDQRDWHEVYAVQSKNGTVIVQIRNHSLSGRSGDITTWQTESGDNGHTWSMPHEICYGFPTHLLNLPSGSILMVYGYRRQPYGNRFRISKDNGFSWSKEHILSDDGENHDLGYPSTAWLSDGSLVTLWYESKNGRAKLRYCRWRLSE